MTGSTSTGKVLGATTGLGASISALPYTAGSNVIQFLVAVIAITCALVIVSAIAKTVIVKLQEK